MYLLVWCYYVPHLLDCSEFSLTHRFHGKFIIVLHRLRVCSIGWKFGSHVLFRSHG